MSIRIRRLADLVRRSGIFGAASAHLVRVGWCGDADAGRTKVTKNKIFDPKDDPIVLAIPQGGARFPPYVVPI